MDGVRYLVGLSNLALLLVIFVGQRAAEKDYCQGEIFNGTCSRNEVVVLQTARFGRMRPGKCISKEYGYIGCSQDVLEYVDGKCSGRPNCSFPVIDFLRDQVQPCPKDVTAYFQASYECVQAAMEDHTRCATNRRGKLTEPSGFISSAMAPGLPATSPPCPWIIEVKPGQKINITLMDFGVYDLRKEAPGGQMVYCNRYAQIWDQSQITPICAGRQRQKNVYISKGNRVEITVLRPLSTEKQPRFLLKYEASGCPTPTAPKNGKIHTHDDTVTVTCNNTKETWFLRCRGNTWVGKARNCSSGESSGVWASIFGREWSSSHGILIVVGLGIGLGIIIGVVLLLVALICLKRRGWAFGCDRRADADRSMAMRVPEQSQYGTAPKGGYMHSADSLLQDNVIDPRPVAYDPRSPLSTGVAFRTVPGPGGDKGRGLVSRLSEGSLGHIYESPDFNSREVYNIVGRDPS